MNVPTAIYLNRQDYTKLRLLLAAALPGAGTPALRQLRDEVDRAVVVDGGDLPAGVVTLDATVEFEDLATGEVEAYAIVFPDRANVQEKRLSILAPIGTALIGCRVGDTVSWATPGGVRELKLRRVTAAGGEPAEAAGPGTGGSAPHRAG